MIVGGSLRRAKTDTVSMFVHCLKKWYGHGGACGGASGRSLSRSNDWAFRGVGIRGIGRAVSGTNGVCYMMKSLFPHL